MADGGVFIANDLLPQRQQRRLEGEARRGEGGVEVLLSRFVVSCGNKGGIGI